MSKKCHYCGGNAEFIGKNWDNEDVFRCKKCGKQGRDNCFSDRPTVFDRITTSPEVLAEKLVYQTEDEFGDVTWSSTIVSGWYVGREDCIAATVAKLEEVAK